MNDDERRHTAHFLGLCYSLHQSAMIQLGKLTDPFTGTVNRNLPAARTSIDLLETLEAKTRGNLTPEESRALATMLTELRLNFVDEQQRESAAPQAGPAPVAPAPVETAQPESAADEGAGSSGAEDDGA